MSPTQLQPLPQQPQPHLHRVPALGVVVLVVQAALALEQQWLHALVYAMA